MRRRALRISRFRLGVGALSCAAALSCGSTPDVLRDAVDTPQAAESGPVRPGIDVLLLDSVGLVRGKRVGLITNQTGLGTAAAATSGRAATDVEILHARPDLRLVALFSPEHGLRGQGNAGERIATGHDPGTGLPVYSLYGATNEPLPAMLEGIDVLLFDIQDVGARYYTYVWTMALAMKAAGAAGIPFVVLDRPNPIGGTLLQGNVLDPSFASFIGLYPVPMRHGMTVGEMARLLVGEFGVRADLHVVPAAGWRREDWYEETGLPWVAPSPNMPSVESAASYPGTCLFEGTNLSVGRGTERPFQWIGAPWLDGAALAAALNAYGLPGVRFEAAAFTPRQPGDAKWPDVEVQGVRFVVTDRAAYDPVRAAVAALIEAKRASGARWRWTPAHFDQLAGTDALRKDIDAGRGLDAVTAGWAEPLARFARVRERYLIYR